MLERCNAASRWVFLSDMTRHINEPQRRRRSPKPRTGVARSL